MHVRTVLFFFQEKIATQREKYIAEHKLRIASLDGNHIFRHCSRAKNARSQVFIDHTVSCSMEPIKYFYGRKVRMIRIRLNQISQRRLQTHHQRLYHYFTCCILGCNQSPNVESL